MLKSRGDDKLLERGCRRTQLDTNVNLEVDLLPIQYNSSLCEERAASL